MGGKILIEHKDVTFAGLAVGAQHLYLVHRDTNGDEYVLRSGPDQFWPFGAEMEIEVNRPIAASKDDRNGSSPESRSSTEIDFGSRDVDDAWSLMVRYAATMEAEGLDYELFGENSNAFVGAMIAAAGGTPVDLLPVGLDPDLAVGLGSYSSLIADFTPPPDGTLWGTTGSDTLTGIQVGEKIIARAGDDTVHAGRGDDVVRGGAGDDILFGQAGSDELRGGSGDDALYAHALDGTGGLKARDKLFGYGGDDDLVGSAGNDRGFGGKGADTLSGGDGNDRLSGGPGDDVVTGGSGNNRLSGGEDADIFVFAAFSFSDHITDFTPGTDRLAFEPSIAGGLSELEIEDIASGTRITLDSGIVRLAGVSVADLDTSDITFAPDAGLLV